MAATSLPIIDINIFQGILELDSPGTDDFSGNLIDTFKSQFVEYLSKILKEFNEKDLKSLSRSAHFLKGSSASLGIARFRITCEKMQYYGELRKLSQNGDFVAVSEEEAQTKIKDLISDMKVYYDEWQQALPEVTLKIKQSLQ